jgi:hypothetical protein
MKDATKKFKEVSNHLKQYFKLELYIDIIIKTCILYVVCIYFSIILEKINKIIFGESNENTIKNKSTPKLWFEILFQISLITPTFFIFKELLFQLFDKFDFLNKKYSTISAKAAVLVSGSAFFTMQESLILKVKELKTRIN